MYEDEGTFCSTWDYCRIYKGVESRHTCANLGHRGKDACPLLFDRQSTFRFQSQVSRIQDGYFIARTIVAIVTHLQHPPRRNVQPFSESHSRASNTFVLLIRRLISLRTASSGPSLFCRRYLVTGGRSHIPCQCGAALHYRQCLCMKLTPIFSTCSRPATYLNPPVSLQPHPRSHHGPQSRRQFPLTPEPGSHTMSDGRDERITRAHRQIRWPGPCIQCLSPSEYCRRTRSRQ